MINKDRLLYSVQKIRDAETDAIKQEFIDTAILPPLKRLIYEHGTLQSVRYPKSVVVKAGEWYCPDCKSMVSRNAFYCWRCGQALKADE